MPALSTRSTLGWGQGESLPCLALESKVQEVRRLPILFPVKTLWQSSTWHIVGVQKAFGNERMSEHVGERQQLSTL